MNTNLNRQIYQSMSLRSTGELLEIWAQNDRTEWSETVFEVIREILTERNIELPAQSEPIVSKPSDNDDDNLETWEENLLEKEDQPEFYDVLDVLDLRKKLEWAARASIVVYALFGFSRLPMVASLLMGKWPSFTDLSFACIQTFAILLSTGLQIVITFLFLKSLANVLRILMEMEFNSRRA